MSDDRPRRPRPAAGRPAGGRPSGGRPGGSRPSGGRPGAKPPARGAGRAGSSKPGTGGGAGKRGTAGNRPPRDGERSRSDDRPGGPPKRSTGGNRPVRDGDRSRSDDRPGRPARAGARPDGRPGQRPGQRRPRRDDESRTADGGRPRGPRGDRTDRPDRGGDRRPRRDEAPRGERPTRPEPRTEAERRAAEVRARRAPRTPKDPALERQQIESRETERWIDEGSIRAEAEAATARASRTAPSTRRPAEVDPEVVAEIHAAAPDPRRAARLAERLSAASAALDRERFDDARRMVTPVVRELPFLAAGHEVNGLAHYRMGRWRQAAQSLELARQIRLDPALLPVLADCYRAMKRWRDVELVWREIRELSPAHEVMAEGRIVAAGALADQGDLKGAVALMRQAEKPPKKVREHHLRQWYVLADLLDRAGDTVGAARLFREVMAHDAEFADVRDRLRALGR